MFQKTEIYRRGPPTVVRMTHFCMLLCKKELTHAVIHRLMSLTCGRLAPMRDDSVCAETHVLVPHLDLQCIICPHLSCRGLSDVIRCPEI